MEMLCCSFPSSLSHLAVSLMQQIKKKCCSTKYCHAISLWGYGNDLLSARKCSIAVFKVVPWVQRNGEVLLIYISGYNCCQALGQRENPAPFHVRLLFLEIVTMGCVCWLGSMPGNASTCTGVLFQNWCFPNVY